MKSYFLLIALFSLSSLVCDIIDLTEYDYSSKSNSYVLESEITIDRREYLKSISNSKYKIEHYFTEETKDRRFPIMISELVDQNGNVLWKKETDTAISSMRSYRTSNSGFTLLHIGSMDNYYNELVWLDLTGDTISRFVDEEKYKIYGVHPIDNGNKWVVVRESSKVSNEIGVESNEDCQIFIFDYKGEMISSHQLNYNHASLVARFEEEDFFVVKAVKELWSRSDLTTLLIDYNGNILHDLKELDFSSKGKVHLAEGNTLLIDGKSTIVDLNTMEITKYSYDVLLGTKEKTGKMLCVKNRQITVLDTRSKILLCHLDLTNKRISNVSFSEDGSQFSYWLGKTMYKYIQVR